MDYKQNKTDNLSHDALGHFQNISSITKQLVQPVLSRFLISNIPTTALQQNYAVRIIKISLSLLKLLVSNSLTNNPVALSSIRCSAFENTSPV